MSENFKLVLGIIIGLICAVAVFCLAVAIGCAVNGLTFGDQICQWFGTSATIDATEMLTNATLA